MSMSYSNLSAEEMSLLQIVCLMAWSDGEFADDEKELLLSKLSQLFSEDEQQALRQQLQEYLSEDDSLGALERLFAPLQFDEDRQMAVKLSYMMIRASRRTSTEPSINSNERATYEQLIKLTGLPTESIEKIEWAAEEELQENDDIVDTVSSRLAQFFRRSR